MPERQKSKQEEIDFLVKEISRHRDLYYNDSAVISDPEYDALELRLQELDTENPILFEIGVDSSPIIPMMSQNKVVKPDDFIKWTKKRNYKILIVHLNYLVTNSDEPTKKYVKAQAQENTQIISEDDFIKMVE